MSFIDQSLYKIADSLQCRQISVMELLTEYIQRAQMGSCITFCHENSVECAENFDRAGSISRKSPIAAGMPFSLKDNICTKGVQTTCNSRMLRNNVPDYSAKAAKKLINLGGILTAKNCMREFSIGKVEDSAFDLVNYITLAEVSKNVNIGAFSLGSDLGLAFEQFFGLWTYKPSDNLSHGIITGSPNLERMTIITRRAEDLIFVYESLTLGKIAPLKLIKPADFADYRVLVYDNLNMPERAVKLFEKAHLNVDSSGCTFLDHADLLHDVIMATDFYESLAEYGKPLGISESRQFKEDYVNSRSGGFGNEVKRQIITGAHLMSDKLIEKTERILEHKESFVAGIYEVLDKYDFIASPLLYDDPLAKASAIAGLPELTIPFAEATPIRIVTKPEKQQELIDFAVYIEEYL